MGGDFVVGARDKQNGCGTPKSPVNSTNTGNSEERHEKTNWYYFCRVLGYDNLIVVMVRGFQVFGALACGFLCACGWFLTIRGPMLLL